MPSVDLIHINPRIFAFTYFLTLPIVSQLGLLAMPIGDGLNAPPSNEDIARVGVHALMRPDAHVGKFYRPTGPELISGHDAAAAMTSAVGRKTRIPLRNFADPTSFPRLTRPLKEELPNILCMEYIPAPTRYDNMVYRRCGASGLKLPAVSLGLWHNFGDDTPHETRQAICRKAFDLGITHFDLANNYGPPPGAAESAFGKMLATDFRGYRDELIISTKAGYLMWDGPYGEWGSRKYLLASLDQSLKRMGLDFVDIFYSHRFDPETPLEETMGALDAAVRSGKALYAGISSYNSDCTRAAARILKDLGTPCLIHQPSYNMINRWVERDGLKETLKELGIGSIAFTPLAQGMLTSKYLKGIPEGSRVTQAKSLSPDFLSEKALSNIRALNAIAERRGQTLAQMAIAWVLRDEGITTALIGASRPSQVEDCAAAVKNLDFTPEELDEIDIYAQEEAINLWARSSEIADS